MGGCTSSSSRVADVPRDNNGNVIANGSTSIAKKEPQPSTDSKKVASTKTAASIPDANMGHTTIHVISADGQQTIAGGGATLQSSSGGTGTANVHMADHDRKMDHDTKVNETPADVDIELDALVPRDRDEVEAKEEESDDDIDIDRVVNDTNISNVDDLRAAPDFGVKLRPRDELAHDPLYVEHHGKYVATRSWLAAAVPPSTVASVNNTPPPSSLTLDWVYGYRCRDSRNNLIANTHGHLVYPAAGVVVCYDPISNTQTHLRQTGGEITCMAQNPADPDVVAIGRTATVGPERRALLPDICIWDTKTNESWIVTAAHRRAVRTLSFSESGNYLVSVGDDDDMTVTVWDWRINKRLASVSAAPRQRKILHVKWRNDTEFITVGTKHVYFWTFTNNGTLTKRKGEIRGDDYRLQTFYCAAWTRKGLAVVGCRDGCLYLFWDGVCRKSISVHSGPIYSVISNDRGLLTGGRDANVCVFDNKFVLQQTMGFFAAIGSVCVQGMKLVVGTENAEVFEVVDYQEDTAPNVVVQAHHDGELWALDINPVNTSQFVTCGEDNKIIIWDANTRKMLKMGIISSKSGPRRRRTKGNLSCEAPNRCARAIAFSPNGDNIAVGTNAGELVVYDTTQLTRIVESDLTLYSVDRKWTNHINAIKYSPDARILAVGTHGCVIVLCDVTNNYQPTVALSHYKCPIMQLDWSSDGNYLQTNSRDFDLAFFAVDKKDLSKSSYVTSPASVRDVKWATQTCALSWSTKGVGDPLRDGCDIRAVDASHDRSLLVAADDFGYVTLFRYPAIEVKTDRHHSVGAHGNRVTNARFTRDTKFVVTTGGSDRTIIQWRLP